MKIDSTDIREFDAKQLSVEFTPPQTTVTVDMFEGALIPSESETYTPLSGITVEVLFRGKDRDEVMTHISDFNALLQKGVVLTLDGYRRKFKGFMTANAPEKTISKERYKSSFKFTGYWFSDDVTISWQEKNEIIFETKGNRWTPCRLTITALEYIETMKINGLSDEITIKTIPRGATVVIDGETGFVTMDGENKFKDVEMFEFPYLKTGKDKEHHIIFSDKNAIVTIQYKPYVNVKKLKKIVSKHSKRKEREKHERMERSVRNGGRTAGGVRHNSVTDNGISETQYQESNERGCRRKENHRMAARGA